MGDQSRSEEDRPHPLRVQDLRRHSRSVASPLSPTDTYVPSPTEASAPSPTNTIVETSSTANDPQSNKSLPAGCSYGPILHLVTKPHHNILTTAVEDSETVPVIWVDFPPKSPDNPFFFSKRRKWAILAVAFFFAHMTSEQVSAFPIGAGTMIRDIPGMTDFYVALGTSAYGWGFAIGPLALAPITEEFGRYWIYIFSVVAYILCHLFSTLGKNVATIDVGRFMLGLAGCIGSTVVAGTVSDLYPPADRGLPMSLFVLCVIIGAGVAPPVFSWVEAAPGLGFRWIHWIQMIATAACLPFMIVILPETRTSIILRRRAEALRKERGMEDGGRYTARGEVEKKHFWASMRLSLSRPLMFLLLEPVVTFFALWASMAWGVLFIQIAGLPQVFGTLHGFNITQSGLTYLGLAAGIFIGFLLNFVQDAIYQRKVATHGIEARLYGAMVAGIGLAVGCIFFGLTAIPSVFWFVPIIGIVIIMASGYTIYQACFVYLAECYGHHASSAVAAMSFLRILLGSSFALFTRQMFDTLTPRWGLFLVGCIAILLAPIPFVAYFKGPWIREHSPYSKKLMAEERARVAMEAGLAAQVVEAQRPGIDPEKGRIDTPSNVGQGEKDIASGQSDEKAELGVGESGSMDKSYSRDRLESWATGSTLKEAPRR